MRTSAIAALCIAPLALAGSLDAGLRSRGKVSERDGLALPRGYHSDGHHSSSKDESFSSSNDNSEISSITQVSETEVILIWLNEGGSATTNTVNSVAAATASLATQTHIVRNSFNQM